MLSYDVKDYTDSDLKLSKWVVYLCIYLVIHLTPKLTLLYQTICK